MLLHLNLPDIPSYVSADLQSSFVNGVCLLNQRKNCSYCRYGSLGFSPPPTCFSSPHTYTSKHWSADQAFAPYSSAPTLRILVSGTHKVHTATSAANTQRFSLGKTNDKHHHRENSNTITALRLCLCEVWNQDNVFQVANATNCRITSEFWTVNNLRQHIHISQVCSAKSPWISWS